MSVHQALYFDIIYLGEISEKQSCWVKEYEHCEGTSAHTAKHLPEKRSAE